MKLKLRPRLQLRLLVPLRRYKPKSRSSPRNEIQQLVRIFEMKTGAASGIHRSVHRQGWGHRRPRGSTPTGPQKSVTLQITDVSSGNVRLSCGEQNFRLKLQPWVDICVCKFVDVFHGIIHMADPGPGTQEPLVRLHSGCEWVWVPWPPRTVLTPIFAQCSAEKMTVQTLRQNSQREKIFLARFRST